MGLKGLICDFIYGSAKSMRSRDKRSYFFNTSLNKFKQGLSTEKENLSKYSERRYAMELLVARINNLQIAYNKLYNVNNHTRKQALDYFEEVCLHEYESIKKCLEIIDKGIPITHENVMPLVKAIVTGLEEKYDHYVLLKTEEIVYETKTLNMLQQYDKSR